MELWLGLAAIALGLALIATAMYAILNVMKDSSKKYEASGALIYIRACMFIVATGLALVVIGFAYLMI